MFGRGSVFGKEGAMIIMGKMQQIEDVVMVIITPDVIHLREGDDRILGFCTFIPFPQYVQFACSKMALHR